MFFLIVIEMLRCERCEGVTSKQPFFWGIIGSFVEKEVYVSELWQDVLSLHNSLG